MIRETKQKRALLAIIAILFLANVATMAMLFTMKPGHKKEDKGSRKSNMSAYLRKDLGFSDAQINTFDSMHARHVKEVDGMMEDMRKEKERRFPYLASQQFDDSVIEAAAGNIAVKQKALEIKMLRHLREVRSISTPEQQAKFDTTFLKFMIREKERKKKNKE